jgi:hypothetical protein
MMMELHWKEQIIDEPCRHLFPFLVVDYMKLIALSRL